MLGAREIASEPRFLEAVLENQTAPVTILRTICNRDSRTASLIETLAHARVISSRTTTCRYTFTACLGIIAFRDCVKGITKRVEINVHAPSCRLVRDGLLHWTGQILATVFAAGLKEDLDADLALARHPALPHLRRECESTAGQR